MDAERYAGELPWDHADGPGYTGGAPPDAAREGQAHIPPGMRRTRGRKSSADFSLGPQAVEAYGAPAAVRGPQQPALGQTPSRSRRRSMDFLDPEESPLLAEVHAGYAGGQGSGRLEAGGADYEVVPPEGGTLDEPQYQAGTWGDEGVPGRGPPRAPPPLPLQAQAGRGQRPAYPRSSSGSDIESRVPASRTPRLGYQGESPRASPGAPRASPGVAGSSPWAPPQGSRRPSDVSSLCSPPRQPPVGQGVHQGRPAPQGRLARAKSGVPLGAVREWEGAAERGSERHYEGRGEGEVEGQYPHGHQLARAQLQDQGSWSRHTGAFPPQAGGDAPSDVAAGLQPGRVSNSPAPSRGRRSIEIQGPSQVQAQGQRHGQWQGQGQGPGRGVGSPWEGAMGPESREYDESYEQPRPKVLHSPLHINVPPVVNNSSSEEESPEYARGVPPLPVNHSGPATATPSARLPPARPAGRRNMEASAAPGPGAVLRHTTGHHPHTHTGAKGSPVAPAHRRSPSESPLPPQDLRAQDRARRRASLELERSPGGARTQAQSHGSPMTSANPGPAFAFAVSPSPSAYSGPQVAPWAHREASPGGDPPRATPSPSSLRDGSWGYTAGDPQHQQQYHHQQQRQQYQRQGRNEDFHSSAAPSRGVGRSPGIEPLEGDFALPGEAPREGRGGGTWGTGSQGPGALAARGGAPPGPEPRGAEGGAFGHNVLQRKKSNSLDGAFGHNVLQRKKSNSLDGLPQEVQWALARQGSGAPGAAPGGAGLRRGKSDCFNLLSLGLTASDGSASSASLAPQAAAAAARYAPGYAPGSGLKSTVPVTDRDRQAGSGHTSVNHPGSMDSPGRGRLDRARSGAVGPSGHSGSPKEGAGTPLLRGQKSSVAEYGAGGSARGGSGVHPPLVRQRSVCLDSPGSAAAKGAPPEGGRTALECWKQVQGLHSTYPPVGTPAANELGVGRGTAATPPGRLLRHKSVSFDLRPPPPADSYSQPPPGNPVPRPLRGAGAENSTHYNSNSTENGTHYNSNSTENSTHYNSHSKILRQKSASLDSWMDQGGPHHRPQAAMASGIPLAPPPGSGRLERQGSGLGSGRLERQGSGMGSFRLERQGSGLGTHILERQGSGMGNSRLERQGSGMASGRLELQGPGLGPGRLERQGSGLARQQLEKQGSGLARQQLERQGSGLESARSRRGPQDQKGGPAQGVEGTQAGPEPGPSSSPGALAGAGTGAGAGAGEGGRRGKLAHQKSVSFDLSLLEHPHRDQGDHEPLHAPAAPSAAPPGGLQRLGGGLLRQKSASLVLGAGGASRGPQAGGLKRESTLDVPSDWHRAAAQVQAQVSSTPQGGGEDAGPQGPLPSPSPSPLHLPHSGAGTQVGRLPKSASMRSRLSQSSGSSLRGLGSPEGEAPQHSPLGHTKGAPVFGADALGGELDVYNDASAPYSDARPPYVDARSPVQGRSRSSSESTGGALAEDAAARGRRINSTPAAAGPGPMLRSRANRPSSTTSSLPQHPEGGQGGGCESGRGMSGAGVGVRTGAGAGATARAAPGVVVAIGAGSGVSGGAGPRTWSGSSSEESSCEGAPREGYSSSTGSLSPWSSDACTPPARPGPCSACCAQGVRCPHWEPQGHAPLGHAPVGAPVDSRTGPVREPAPMCLAQRAQSVKLTRAHEGAISASEELQRILDEFDADTDSECGSGSLEGPKRWGIDGQEGTGGPLAAAVAPRVRLARGNSCNTAVALSARPSMDGKGRRAQYEEGVVATKLVQK